MTIYKIENITTKQVHYIGTVSEINNFLSPDRKVNRIYNIIDNLHRNLDGWQIRSVDIDLDELMGKKTS